MYAKSAKLSDHSVDVKSRLNLHHNLVRLTFICQRYPAKGLHAVFFQNLKINVHVWCNTNMSTFYSIYCQHNDNNVYISYCNCTQSTENKHL